MGRCIGPLMFYHAMYSAFNHTQISNAINTCEIQEINVASLKNVPSCTVSFPSMLKVKGSFC